MSTTKKHPTNAQIQFVNKIAKRLGITPPPNVFEDSFVCSKYIEENKDKWKISDKQKKVLERVGSETANELSTKTFLNRDEFIEATKMIDEYFKKNNKENKE